MERQPITYRDSLSQIVEKMAEDDPRADLVARVVIEQSGYNRAQDLIALNNLNIRGTDLVLACIAYIHYVKQEYSAGCPNAAKIYEEICDSVEENPRLGAPYDEFDRPFKSSIARDIYDFACGISDNKAQERLIVNLINDQDFLYRLYKTIPGLPKRSWEEITVSSPFKTPVRSLDSLKSQRNIHPHLDKR